MLYQNLSWFRSSGNSHQPLMAACGATIKGRRKILRHHNFRSRSAFSFQFTVQRLVRIAIDANIPVKTIFPDHDFAKVSFDDRFRNILAFFRAGILREGILQNRELLLVMFDHLGFAFLAQPNISRSARTFFRFSSFCSSVSSVLTV